MIRDLARQIAPGSRVEVRYRAADHKEITADEVIGRGIAKKISADRAWVTVKLDGEHVEHDWPASVCWAIAESDNEVAYARRFAAGTAVRP